MRSLFVGLLVLAMALPAAAQTPNFRNDYYNCRRAAHTREGMPRSGVVWIGDSITEQGWWSLLSDEEDMVNRGIGGDNTYGMLDRLPEILDFAPRKIFLMAGVNDLSGNRPVEEVATNIRKMLKMIRERVPTCEIYLQSVLTPNNDVLAYPYAKGKQAETHALNRLLHQYCDEGLATWVDLTPILHNEKGELRVELTKDGIHLHPEAYQLWVGHLKAMHYLSK